MKFRINKKVAIYLGIIVLVGAVAVLGTSGSQKLGEKDDLQKELSTAQSKLQSIKLDPLSGKPAELDKQITEISPEIEALRAKLTVPVNSTNATSGIFEVARTHNLAVEVSTSSSPQFENISGVPLSSISLTATVSGRLSRIIDFIAELNSTLKTSAITSVEMEVPVIINADNTTATNGENTTAKIGLVVYTY